MKIIFTDLTGIINCDVTNKSIPEMLRKDPDERYGAYIDMDALGRLHTIMDKTGGRLVFTEYGIGQIFSSDNAHMKELKKAYEKAFNYLHLPYLGFIPDSVDGKIGGIDRFIKLYKQEHPDEEIESFVILTNNTVYHTYEIYDFSDRIIRIPIHIGLQEYNVNAAVHVLNDPEFKYGK